MSDTPILKIGGPASDLESFYIRKPASLLPDPPGFPFNKQGKQLETTPKINTSYREVDQATHDRESNPLPFTYWTGTSKRQIHQGGPTFSLGVNENRKI